MKVFKDTEKTGYTIVPNGILRSRNISLKALGIYYLIVSLPDDWNCSVNGLCTLCSDGKGSMRTAVRELEKAGFLHRIKPSGGVNRFSDGDWIISDFPLTEKQSADSPSQEKPAGGKSATTK